MTLTSRQNRYLRGLTHHLQPVVMVADKGLSENVMAEIESALEHHELIKIKLRGNRETRGRWIKEISKACSTEPVQVIGQVACFFRRNPKKPVIALPDNSQKV
ncbi:MAG: ribosome assembly RNA-binding protein YhbY [Xanthomonadales bacterium]|nr:ribosome assembly RNA-binding protein YhbY [Xanthomonadales bacterium]